MTNDPVLKVLFSDIPFVFYGANGFRADLNFAYEIAEEIEWSSHMSDWLAQAYYWLANGVDA